MIVRCLATAAAAACALFALPAPMPSASADPCPDVDVTFARGTNEPPPTGPVGDAFVAALRPQVGAKSLTVYGVNYPATMDFSTGVDGINDARAHITDMAKSCPQTKMVLSGFSQGAAVMGFVTASAVPDGIPDDIPQSEIPKPMPPDVANHVAAVVLFGTPSDRFMGTIGQPHITIGQLYAPKLLELCDTGDPVCDDGGGDWAAHGLYDVNGMATQGANFAASKL